MSENKPRSCNKTVIKNINCLKKAKHVANKLNLQIHQLKQQLKEKGGKAVKTEIMEGGGAVRCYERGETPRGCPQKKV